MCINGITVMKTDKKSVKKTEQTKEAIIRSNFVERIGESWTYIKTVVDIVREPILILDEDLRVVVANEPFYTEFQVEPKDTENKVVYELGNGQWNIPSLKKLLEDILPKNTFFKGFEVVHTFPFIGDKVMILNARQIFCKDDPKLGPCPPIILLAIEDVTEMMSVAKKISDHTNDLETKISERVKKLEELTVKLEQEMKMVKRS